MSSAVGFTYKGDWKEFEKFLNFDWGVDLSREIGQATRRSAMYILAEIRKRIHDREYEVNTLSTAIRKGFTSVKESTPLVDSSKMIREALATERLRKWTWEVGIIKDMPTDTNRMKMSELVPILHEGKTIKRGNKTYRIPPRPFLREVFDDPSIERYVNKQWSDAYKKVLKKHGKL